MTDAEIALAAEGIKLVGGQILQATKPALSIPWEMAFVLYGYVMERRKDKAIEWVTMFKDNAECFTDAVVEDPHFQDAFVNSLEKYLRERSEVKRAAMLGIFLGFAKAEAKDEFPLERFYAAVDSISPRSFRRIREILAASASAENPFFQPYGGDAESITEREESIYELVAMNILIVDPTPRFGPLYEPFVKFTEFGSAFVAFLKGNR